MRLERCHQIVALCALSTLSLLAWRLSPARPRPAGDTTRLTRCENPVVVVGPNNRQLLTCAPRATVATSSVLAKVPSCDGRPNGRRQRVEAGTRLVIDDGCRVVRRDRLAGTDRIVVGLRIDPNRASAVELEALPRIGRVLARRIVDHRRQHGRFEDLDQLRRVKGIGPYTLRRIRPYLAVTPCRPLDGQRAGVGACE